MTNLKHVIVNQGYVLGVTPPEEGAGVAYSVVQTGLMDRLGILHHGLPMDLASRILSDGKAVADASEYIKNNKTATYVKGPGITPRDDQVLDTVIWLEKTGKLIFTDSTLNQKVSALRDQLKPHESEENMIRFAYEIGGVNLNSVDYHGRTLANKKGLLKPIGSPNAAWRDVLQANLSRGTSDALSERSMVQPAAWSEQTPLVTFAYAPVEGKNRLTTEVKEATTIKVEFIADGQKEVTLVGQQKISAGTPIRLFTTGKQTFLDWADTVLDQIKASDAQIVHGTKQTVLKKYDNALIGWLQEAVNKKGLSDKIAPFARKSKDKAEFGNLLVDDLFARLSTSTLKDPTAVIAPNHSYSGYVKDVWDLVKKKGGFKPSKHSEVVRASATGDHYKSIEFQAPTAGTIRVVDEKGTALLEKHLASGDVAKATHFNRERVRNLVKQSLDSAKTSGRNHMLFGFDDDAYYRVAVDELNIIKGQYPGLNIRVMSAAEATAEYLTAGVKDTILVLGNINGDFATDIEPFGKGTSYSTGVIFDGRKVVELGAGGTAPDLIVAWKEQGVLKFNPMSFLEGISLATRFAAEQMQKDGKDAALAFKVADAIEAGMYATTDKGIVVPVVKGKFRSQAKDYTIVSTHTFVKSVEVEAMKLLKGVHPAVGDAAIAQAETELKRMIVIDAALYAAAEKFGGEKHNKRWEHANIAWHDARIASGEVDLLNPDYTISLPPSVDPMKLDADSLMKLQESRVALIKSKSVA